MCFAGLSRCDQAYTVWNDDWATHGCESEYDLRLSLCSTEDNSNEETLSYKTDMCHQQLGGKGLNRKWD